jgi:hypothetical protein
MWDDANGAGVSNVEMEVDAGMLEFPVTLP